MNEIGKVTIKNKYGVRVVKCCASCKHKEFDNKLRICLNGMGDVRPTDLCTDWQMREALDNAGKGGGKVHTKQWLYYLHEHTPTGGSLSKQDKDDLVRHYEKLHGSRFITKGK